jgi:hypothetical protein
VGTLLHSESHRLFESSIFEYLFFHVAILPAFAGVTVSSYGRANYVPVERRPAWPAMFGLVSLMSTSGGESLDLTLGSGGWATDLSSVLPGTG